MFLLLLLQHVDPAYSSKPEDSDVLFNGESAKGGVYTLALKNGENKVAVKVNNGSENPIIYNVTINRVEAVYLEMKTERQMHWSACTQQTTSVYIRKMEDLKCSRAQSIHGPHPVTVM